MLDRRPRFLVKRVERVENARAWQRYAALRRQMAAGLSQQDDGSLAREEVRRQWYTNRRLPHAGPLSSTQLEAAANEVFAFLQPRDMCSRDAVLLQALTGALRTDDEEGVPTACVQGSALSECRHPVPEPPCWLTYL